MGAGRKVCECCETLLTRYREKTERAANLVNLYTKTSERRKEGREGARRLMKRCDSANEGKKEGARASQLVEVSSSSTDSFALNDCGSVKEGRGSAAEKLLSIDINEPK